MKIGKLLENKTEATQNTALEEFKRIGLLDDRDIDFLYHLYIPATEEIALEGIIGATLKNVAGNFNSNYTEMKGWLLGVESKRRYVEEICEDLVEWLENKKADNKNLDLDMGTFKTWMKTSETFMWRYFFLLSDSMWSETKVDLQKGDITNIETILNIDWRERSKVARMLDSLRTIDDLIKIVELYKKRSNEYFLTIIKRETKIKNAPFQVILLGATDLRLTVKKIVNLAL